MCPVCRLPSKRLYRDACDECNRRRQSAAIEFIHAAEAVRLMSRAGARVTTTIHSRRHRNGHVEHAIARLAKANSACIALGMWTAERSTRRPPWFYGDERSNS